MPMVTVDTPIVSSAATSVVLRPTRSPKWPNSAEPIGRAMKAMANVARDASVADAGSDFGKNSGGETGTPAGAQMYKSKKSIVVPLRLADKTCAGLLITVSATLLVS